MKRCPNCFQLHLDAHESMTCKTCQGTLQEVGSLKSSSPLLGVEDQLAIFQHSAPEELKRFVKNADQLLAFQQDIRKYLELKQELGRDPSPAELIKFCRITPGKFKMVQAFLQMDLTNSPLQSILSSSSDYWHQVDVLSFQLLHALSMKNEDTNDLGSSSSSPPLQQLADWERWILKTNLTVTEARIVANIFSVITDYLEKSQVRQVMPPPPPKSSPSQPSSTKPPIPTVPPPPPEVPTRSPAVPPPPPRVPVLETVRPPKIPEEKIPKIPEEEMIKELQRLKELFKEDD